MAVMRLRFHCRNCAARVKVPEGSQGKKVKCPKCGFIQSIPEWAWPADAPPKRVRFRCKDCRDDVFAPGDAYGKVVSCGSCGAEQKVPPTARPADDGEASQEKSASSDASGGASLSVAPPRPETPAISQAPSADALSLDDTEASSVHRPTDSGESFADLMAEAVSEMGVGDALPLSSPDFDAPKLTLADDKPNKTDNEKSDGPEKTETETETETEAETEIKPSATYTNEAKQTPGTPGTPERVRVEGETSGGETSEGETFEGETSEGEVDLAEDLGFLDEDVVDRQGADEDPMSLTQTEKALDELVADLGGSGRSDTDSSEDTLSTLDEEEDEEEDEEAEEIEEEAEDEEDEEDEAIEEEGDGEDESEEDEEDEAQEDDVEESFETEEEDDDEEEELIDEPVRSLPEAILFGGGDAGSGGDGGGEEEGEEDENEDVEDVEDVEGEGDEDEDATDDEEEEYEEEYEEEDEFEEEDESAVDESAIDDDVPPHQPGIYRNNNVHAMTVATAHSASSHPTGTTGQVNKVSDGNDANEGNTFALLGPVAWLLRILAIVAVLMGLVWSMSDPGPGDLPRTLMHKIGIVFVGLVVAGICWGVGEMAAAVRAIARRG